MPTLEKFFQIAVIVTIISIGLTFTITAFAKNMLPQRVTLADLNITTTPIVNYGSSINQSSEETQEGLAIILDWIGNAILNTLTKIVDSVLVANVFPLANLILLTLAPYGTPFTEIAIGLSSIIAFFQIMAGVYVTITIITIIRGSGVGI